MANISELSAEANITNEALDFKAAFLRDIKGNVTLQEYSDNKVKLSNDVVYEIRKLENDEDDTAEKYAIFRNDVKIASNIEKNINPNSEYVLNENFFTYIPNAHVVATNWIYYDGKKKNIESNSYLVGNETNSGIQSGLIKTYGTDIREVIYHSNDSDDRIKRQYISETNLPNVLDNMFSKSGYVIAGYSTSEFGSLELFVGDAIPEDVSDLYAVWKKLSNNISVIFHSSSGSFPGGFGTNTVSYELVHTANGTNFNCTDGQYLIPYDGSNLFVGWSLREDLGGQIYRSVSDLEDIAYDDLNLYATYAPADCEYLNGANLIIKLKRIAGDYGPTQTSDNASIRKIIWTDEKIDPNIQDEAHTISNGTTPIYAWFEADVIYISSEGNYPKFNTNISYLLSGLKNLESPSISESFGVADTSNCASMDYLYYNCSSLTRIDTSMIDTSSCHSLQHMFDGCKSLRSIDLTHFKTSSVNNFESMFASCETLGKLDVTNFTTSGATNFSSMFSNCKLLTSLDVSSFNVRNAQTMSWMFDGCENLTTLDLSSWQANNIQDLEGTFSNLPKIESLDLSGFSTDNCTDMRCLFKGCSRLKELDLSNFDTTNVETQERNGNKLSLAMFSGCSKLETITFGQNCTFEKIEVFESLFQECTNLVTLDLSMFNTSSATNMRSMFYKCENLESINMGSFDTTHVTTFNNFLFNCGRLLKVDLSSFATDSCIDFTNMFAGDTSLTTIYASNQFVVNENVSTDYMFNGCSHLVGGAGTTYSYSSNYRQFAHIDSPSNPGYFTAKS